MLESMCSQSFEPKHERGLTAQQNRHASGLCRCFPPCKMRAYTPRYECNSDQDYVILHRSQPRLTSSFKTALRCRASTREFKFMNKNTRVITSASHMPSYGNG